MKTMALLVTMVGLMGVTGEALASPDSLVACETEDSVGCYWDAATQGNGRGRSLVNDRHGNTHYEGSLEYSLAFSGLCESETSCAEQVAPGVWRAVCGDADGAELVISCDEHAWLMSEIGESIGVRGDAAYEDAYASCTEGR